MSGSQLISTLLVANRGEIARRIFASCRLAGIGCVAVYSDPDAAEPHVREADAAVRLPGASPAQTYLNGPAIVAAALAAGADAVHPGYGFLSEDAAFARAVLAAGLTWVGPPPDAIEAMGSKITAKKIAAGVGVPVLPMLDPAAAGSLPGPSDAPGSSPAAASDPGPAWVFPVLVKASGGGGGRGMRVVRDAAELPAAIEAARREAQAAFGDPAVFCEPLLPSARHVEVQVLADAHGTVWTLTERDCSVQRRYQKVIEETPSPAVGPRLRGELLAAAAAITTAVGYRNAGTAEFLVTADGQFFFLEFNTRLQVEHPVTECVHGIDLVAWQLDIAQGLPLPAEPPAAAGHAIEARLYAEDPAAGYLPASGTMHRLDIPGVQARFGLPPALARPPGSGLSAAAILRLDAGIESGSEISPHYDPMLAKVIAWAPTRLAAARRLASALERARIHGPATNRALLVSVLRDPRFGAGQADTGLLDGYDLAGLAPSDAAIRLSAVAAALAGAALARAGAPVLASLPPGWRNVRSQPLRRSFAGPAGQVDVGYAWTRDGIEIAAAGGPERPDQDLDLIPRVVACTADEVLLEVSGVQHRFEIGRAGGVVWVDSGFGPVALTPVGQLPVPAAPAAGGSLIAPMPGTLVRVYVAIGAPVHAGQPVLILEAMKMEHQILAPADGVLAELRAEPGAQVKAGDVLAILAAEPAGSTDTTDTTGTTGATGTQITGQPGGRR